MPPWHIGAKVAPCGRSLADSRRAIAAFRTLAGDPDSPLLHPRLPDGRIDRRDAGAAHLAPRRDDHAPPGRGLHSDVARRADRRQGPAARRIRDVDPATGDEPQIAEGEGCRPGNRDRWQSHRIRTPQGRDGRPRRHDTDAGGQGGRSRRQAGGPRGEARNVWRADRRGRAQCRRTVEGDRGSRRPARGGELPGQLAPDRAGGARDRGRQAQGRRGGAEGQAQRTRISNCASRPPKPRRCARS